MAEFCNQCSRVLFDQPGDFEGLTTVAEYLTKHLAAVVLCEGCGPIQVDPSGDCISVDCYKKHGKESNRNE